VEDISMLMINGKRYVQKCKRLISEKRGSSVQWLNFYVMYCQTTRRNVTLKHKYNNPTQQQIPTMITPKCESSDDDAKTIDLRELEKTPQFQDR
jgi:hypothetical protein